MATAEKLLNEAQFAYNNISFAESPANRRNRSRATTLAKRIIRQYPTTMEAGEAHAILRRLGEEAFASKMSIRHRHAKTNAHKNAAHSRAPAPVQAQTLSRGQGEQVEQLNWAGMLSKLLKLPKGVLAFFIFAALFLYGVFGLFLIIPMIVAVVVLGPFEILRSTDAKRTRNDMIATINAWIEGAR